MPQGAIKTTETHCAKIHTLFRRTSAHLNLLMHWNDFTTFRSIDLEAGPVSLFAWELVMQPRVQIPCDDT